jgi:hypothetical protein
VVRVANVVSNCLKSTEHTSRLNFVNFTAHCTLRWIGRSKFDLFLPATQTKLDLSDLKSRTNCLEYHGIISSMPATSDGNFHFSFEILSRFNVGMADLVVTRSVQMTGPKVLHRLLTAFRKTVHSNGRVSMPIQCAS